MQLVSIHIDKTIHAAHRWPSVPRQGDKIQMLTGLPGTFTVLVTDVLWKHGTRGDLEVDVFCKRIKK